MDYNNTIAIVCNKTSTIDNVMNKLLLLRNIDEVTTSTLEGAPFKLKPKIPNVIIIHCEDDNEAGLSCIYALKLDAQLKEVPIILLANNYSREFFISAYEAGVSEIITGGVEDYELLIRTIWALRRNEIDNKNEVRDKFLNKIDILDPETGFYAKKYGEDFISSEVATSFRYGGNACVLLISSNRRPQLLSDTIRQSIRIADSVAISNKENFYIFLPKTKLAGANTVFERINANFRLEGGLKASAAEVGKNQFSALKPLLEEALKKTKNGLTLIGGVVYAPAPLPEPKKESLEIRKGDNKLKKLKAKKNLENFTESIRDKVKDVETLQEEQGEEERNSILFRQSFAKKMQIVIEPLFKKYSAYVNENFEKVIVDSAAFHDKCEFSISKGELTTALIIRHGGLSKVEIDMMSLKGAEKRVKRTTMEIIELDFEKISKMITMLIGEFKKND